MKPVSARLPVRAISRSSPIVRLDLVALGLRALVVPEDRGSEGAVVRVEGHEAVHLPAQPDALRVAGGRPEVREDGLGGAPPVVGVLLGPSGARGGQRVLGFLACDDRAIRRDRQALGGAGSDVDAYEDRHVGGWESLATGSGCTMRPARDPPNRPSGRNCVHVGVSSQARRTRRSQRWPQSSGATSAGCSCWRSGSMMVAIAYRREVSAGCTGSSGAYTRSAGLPRRLTNGPAPPPSPPTPPSATRRRWHCGGIGGAGTGRTR